MKIRNDYVSNSSSSSFILAVHEAFEFFKVSRQDILDALIDGFGGKEAYDKYVEKMVLDRKSHPELYSEEEEEMMKRPVGPFYVYDLSDKEDRKRAIEDWGGLLAQWQSTNCRYINDEKQKKKRSADSREITIDPDTIDNYDKVLEGMARIYGISEWELRDGVAERCDPNVVPSRLKPVTRFVHDRKKDPKTGMYGHYEPVDQSLVDALVKIRRECGVMTNLDVLKSKPARFFVHCDDNELSYGAVAEEDESKWDTKPYTYDRVCEVLFKYLVKTGRLNPDDPKFLESMRIDEKRLSKYDKDRGEIYNFFNGKSMTWKDLRYNSSLTWNMHEG